MRNTWFGERIDGLKGRRKASREPLKLEAVVQTIGERGGVVIEDVSRTGARFSGSVGPAEGDLVLIRIASKMIYAEAMWRRKDEGQCGILFDEPLDELTFKAFRTESLKFVQSALSPEEYRAIDDWRTGKAR